MAEGFLLLGKRFFCYDLNFTTEGAKFVFGNLGVSPGQNGSLGIFFAFQVFRLLFSLQVLMSILYYLGIMQRIVQGMAWVMAKVMGTSGAESFPVLQIFLLDRQKLRL